MSDTMKLVLWIAVALVVIALIVWFFVASSRRRQLELQRADAAGLRAQVQERLPEVQDAQDRASVTGQIAQEARAEAEAKAAEAARLESQAQEHRARAESAQREREALEREADRVDPDVPTDEQGHRLDEERGAFGRPGGAPGSVASGSSISRPGAGAGAAAAVGAAAAGGAVAATHPFADDEEPDLADAENPFASQGGPVSEAEPVGEPAVTGAHEVPVDGEPERPSMEPAAESAALGEPVSRSAESTEPTMDLAADTGDDAGEDADWVNSPVDEDVDDELAASAVQDSQAEDWINGPTDGEDEMSGAAEGAGAAIGADDPDWVNSPVDEDVDDELAASAGEDSQAEDWINGPGDEADDVPQGGPRPDEGATAERATAEPTAATSDADWVNGPVDEDSGEATRGEVESSGAEDAHAADWINGPDDTDTDTTVRAPMPSAADPMAETEVSVPALEHTDEVLVDGGTPSDDPGDHRGQPWSTSFGSRPAAQSEPSEPAEPAAPPRASEEAGAGDDSEMAIADQAETPSADDPGPVEHSDDAPLLDDASGTDEGDEDAATEPASARRVSSFEEVHDGGYGIGSAAPLEDRAQPMGHAVKAWRDTNTFRSPGTTRYDDAEPDVWFFNEEAARRAGFRPADE